MLALYTQCRVDIEYNPDAFIMNLPWWFNLDNIDYKIFTGSSTDLILTQETIAEYNILSNKASQIIQTNEKFSTVLDRIDQSYNNMHEERFSISFLLSWKIIEYYINKIWNELIERQGFNKTRAKKLTINPIYLTVDHKIEMLNLYNIIDEEEYLNFIAFKKKRNNFIHKLYVINKETAQKAFKLSKALINQLLDNQ